MTMSGRQKETKAGLMEARTERQTLNPWIVRIYQQSPSDSLHPGERYRPEQDRLKCIEFEIHDNVIRAGNSLSVMGRRLSLHGSMHGMSSLGANVVSPHIAWNGAEAVETSSNGLSRPGMALAD